MEHLLKVLNWVKVNWFAALWLVALFFTAVKVVPIWASWAVPFLELFGWLIYKIAKKRK